jgi:hypothetical protein
MTNATKYSLKVTAPFLVGGRWVWLTCFDIGGGNKHAAIINHAAVVGATAWDFGQADCRLVRS